MLSFCLILSPNGLGSKHKRQKAENRLVQSVLKLNFLELVFEMLSRIIFLPWCLGGYFKKAESSINVLPLDYKKSSTIHAWSFLECLLYFLGTGLGETITFPSLLVNLEEERKQHIRLANLGSNSICFGFKHFSVLY